MEPPETVTVHEFLQTVETNFLAHLTLLPDEYINDQSSALKIPPEALIILWKDVLKRNVETNREENIQILLSITHPLVASFILARQMNEADPINWDELKSQLLSSLQLKDTRIDNTLFTDWNTLDTESKKKLVSKTSFDIPVNLVGNVLTILIQGIEIAVQSSQKGCS